jgi:hypothetical protein
MPFVIIVSYIRTSAVNRQRMAIVQRSSWAEALTIEHARGYNCERAAHQCTTVLT